MRLNESRSQSETEEKLERQKRKDKENCSSAAEVLSVPSRVPRCCPISAPTYTPFHTLKANNT